MDLTFINCTINVDGQSKELNSANISESTRIKWITAVQKIFDERDMTQNQQEQWVVDLYTDGKASMDTGSNKDKQICQIPSFQAAYQIPLSAVHKLGLDNQSKISHQQRFAFGSLLYEIMTDYPPFHDVHEDEIEARFRMGEFPTDVGKLNHRLDIVSNWCQPCGEEMRDYDSKKPWLDKIRWDRIKGEFWRLLAFVGKAFIIMIVITVVGSCVLSLLLGILGFSVLGPVAGSIAAVWQSSIGIVVRGSVFAFLQSIAMAKIFMFGLVQCLMNPTLILTVTVFLLLAYAISWAVALMNPAQAHDDFRVKFQEVYMKYQGDNDSPPIDKPDIIKTLLSSLLHFFSSVWEHLKSNLPHATSQVVSGLYEGMVPRTGNDTTDYSKNLLRPIRYLRE